MDVGLEMPIFGPAATRNGLREVATLSEELGFESLWIGDHIAMPAQFDSKYDYTLDGRYPGDRKVNRFDAFTGLAFTASITETVKLGTSVLIAPYRHPLETAKMWASLDVLSGGRVLVGVGVGWLREEFDALGIPPSERGARTDEVLSIWKSAWSEGEVTFAGRYYEFDRVYTRPKTIQRPHPPILVGGYSMKAMNRVIEHGDEWMVVLRGPTSSVGPTGSLAEDIVYLRRLAAERGRDPNSIRVTGCLVPGIAESGKSGTSAFLCDYEKYAASGLDRIILYSHVYPAGDLDTITRNLMAIGASGYALRST